MRWARAVADAIADIPYERRSPVPRWTISSGMAMSRPTELTDRVMGAAPSAATTAACSRARPRRHLIARPQHVEAVQKRGCAWRRRRSTRTCPSGERGGERRARRESWCCFSVKSTDTERAGGRRSPHTSSAMRSSSRCRTASTTRAPRRALGREVVPAVVYVAVEMAGPGHVRHHGRASC